MKKTKLLAITNLESDILSPNIDIIPVENKMTIFFEKDVQLSQNQEWKGKCMQSDHEIFYVISGSGILKSDEDTELIERGDRVILDKGSEYVICNTTAEPLRLVNVGVNRVAL